jgi:hypothetical protein
MTDSGSLLGGCVLPSCLHGRPNADKLPAAHLQRNRARRLVLWRTHLSITVAVHATLVVVLVRVAVAAHKLALVAGIVAHLLLLWRLLVQMMGRHLMKICIVIPRIIIVTLTGWWMLALMGRRWWSCCVGNVGRHVGRIRWIRLTLRLGAIRQDGVTPARLVAAIGQWLGHINRWFAPLHCQRIQLHGRCKSTDFLRLENRPVRLQRRMFVFGFADRFGGGSMLGLLDTQSFGRVLFVAQFQCYGETLFMGWTFFAGQTVLMFDLKSCKNVNKVAEGSCCGF